MHRYIVVKIGGSKKRKLYENRGKFINFAEIGEEYALCIIDLVGEGHPCIEEPARLLLNTDVSDMNL